MAWISNSDVVSFLGAVSNMGHQALAAMSDSKAVAVVSKAATAAKNSVFGVLAVVVSDNPLATGLGVAAGIAVSIVAGIAAAVGVVAVTPVAVAVVAAAVTVTGWTVERAARELAQV